MQSSLSNPVSTGLKEFFLPVKFISKSLGAILLILCSFQSYAQNQYSPSVLGPFELQPRTENPLRPKFNSRLRPGPVPVDYDADGDIDIAIGDYYGGNGLYFLRNDGTPSLPQFNEAFYSENPLYFNNFSLSTAPAFIDMDDDGDMDMVTGNEDGSLEFYLSKGGVSNPYIRQTTTWNNETKTGNPFHDLNLGPYTRPVFADLDGDNDLDLIVGTSYLPSNKSIHFFINNGSGNFTPAILTGINPPLEQVSPALIDVNGDHELDIVLGAKNGNLYYFERTGPTSFEEKTGNDNPFSIINKGQYSNPASADLDNDGDEDLLLGAANNILDIHYFRNDGSKIFAEINGFENPFGGYGSGSESYPYFIDVDKDGNIDVIVGSSDNQIHYLRNFDGYFKQVSSNNPFDGISTPESFYPSLIDIDGDGDEDLLGSGRTGDHYYIELYLNDHGSFNQVNRTTGPFKNIVLEKSFATFGDIDGDGDYDMISSDEILTPSNENQRIKYFENTGTIENPEFTERTGSANPFANVTEGHVLFPRLIDIDHDGDQDLLIGEGGTTVEIEDGNEFSFYENISSGGNVEFVYRGDLVEQGANPYEPAPSFVDIDHDGDLDIFFGTRQGDLYLYKNINEPAQLQLDPTPLNVMWDNGPVIIDNSLVLFDSDNDSIVTAQVRIIDYEEEREQLLFTPQAGISANWNESTGSLTFNGKAPIIDYQTILRSVKLEYNRETSGSNGRTQASVSRTIEFNIMDADGTHSNTGTRTITFSDTPPPIFTDAVVSLGYQGSQTLLLSELITDADNNVDLHSLEIINHPPSGATASIDDNFWLILNYEGIDFTGTEQVRVLVCDADNNCDTSIITVHVSTNSAPIINPIAVVTPYKGFVTVNLLAMVDDDDNNLDPGTFAVIDPPATGATATINASYELRIDYSESTFAGVDVVAIRVCDEENTCAEGTITITVQNSAPVIAPEPISTPQGTVKTLNLMDIISDADGNLSIESLIIVEQPISGATVSIQPVSSNEIHLILDYSGITFNGEDHLTIRACDQAGACSESVLTVMVEVVSSVEVFNALAPSSSGNNKYLRIQNLPNTNTVSIFNRWGDEVFKVKNYDNETNRFEGIGSNGKPLSTGTYFYTVEFVDGQNQKKKLTGYISLKN